MKRQMAGNGRVIPKHGRVVCGEHGDRADNERATLRSQEPPPTTRLPFELGRH